MILTGVINSETFWYVCEKILLMLKGLKRGEPTAQKDTLFPKFSLIISAERADFGDKCLILSIYLPYWETCVKKSFSCCKGEKRKWKQEHVTQRGTLYVYICGSLSISYIVLYSLKFSCFENFSIFRFFVHFYFFVSKKLIRVWKWGESIKIWTTVPI